MRKRVSFQSSMGSLLETQYMLKYQRISSASLIMSVSMRKPGQKGRLREARRSFFWVSRRLEEGPILERGATMRSRRECRMRHRCLPGNVISYQSEPSHDYRSKSSDGSWLVLSQTHAVCSTSFVEPVWAKDNFHMTNSFLTSWSTATIKILVRWY